MTLKIWFILFVHVCIYTYITLKTFCFILLFHYAVPYALGLSSRTPQIIIPTTDFPHIITCLPLFFTYLSFIKIPCLNMKHPPNRPPSGNDYSRVRRGEEALHFFHCFPHLSLSSSFSQFSEFSLSFSKSII